MICTKCKRQHPREINCAKWIVGSMLRISRTDYAFNEGLIVKVEEVIPDEHDPQAVVVSFNEGYGPDRTTEDLSYFDGMTELIK